MNGTDEAINEPKVETFQQLVADNDILVVPGCYDALSAKIIEKNEFDAAYVSGAGVSNTMLGLADLGLATYTEMAEQIRQISEATSIPVLADADTGYGNPLNVRRTVHGFEHAGAAGLQIEDQMFPKRCGHFNDHDIIPTEEMVKKIEAAVEARNNREFSIVARTDVRSVNDVDSAIERAHAYERVGADIIFPEALRSAEEMRQFCDALSSPVMANMVEGGKTPLLSASELETIGYDLVIFPNSLLRTAMLAMQQTAEELAETGSVENVLEDIASFDLRNELTDYDKLIEFEQRYSTDN